LRVNVDFRVGSDLGLNVDLRVGSLEIGP